MVHKRLLLKLEKIGIGSDLLNWIRSFLTGRTQCVKIDGMLFEWKSVSSGVLQGSVLGLLLFVIFINDMPDKVKFNICTLFADDCKIYGSVGTKGYNSLQLYLRRLENWQCKLVE